MEIPKAKEEAILESGLKHGRWSPMFNREYWLPRICHKLNIDI